MIRANLLFCICCVGIVKCFGDDDLSSEPPLCEEKTPAGAILDLSNMGLVNISRNLVSNPAVTCLNLAGNAIRTFEPGTFDGLPELKYLNLSMNPIKFDDFMNMSFPKLETLVMDRPFKQDERYDQGGEDYHENGNLKKVSPNLKKLSLRQYYGLFDYSWLQNLIPPNLTHLYLSKNDLIYFTVSPQIGFSIEHIDLDYNKISRFENSHILYTENLLPNLRSLSMNHNYIEGFCGESIQNSCMDLRNMTQLKQLFLWSNVITELKRTSFMGLDNLSILDLGNNMIRNISMETFDSTPALEVLKLNDNWMKQPPPICGLKNLVELRLEGNKILYLNKMSFCGLPKLAVIDLSRNGLQSVKTTTFSGLLSLKELDLSWNKITSLPDGWSGFKSNLHTLRLDGNFFKYFANMSLGNLKELELLSVRQNPT